MVPACFSYCRLQVGVGSGVSGQDRDNLAIPSRLHRPSFDHFPNLVHGFSQLLLIKISAPSLRGFQHMLANLEELKTFQ
jgi:hypothetical protein